MDEMNRILINGVECIVLRNAVFPQSINATLTSTMVAHNINLITSKHKWAIFSITLMVGNQNITQFRFVDRTNNILNTGFYAARTPYTFDFSAAPLIVEATQGNEEFVAWVQSAGITTHYLYIHAIQFKIVPKNQRILNKMVVGRR